MNFSKLSFQKRSVEYIHVSQMLSAPKKWLIFYHFFNFQKFVASVLVNGHSRSSEAVGTLSASQSLAHSYGTMDNKEPASDHVIADTGASYQQPSYTHDS